MSQNGESWLVQLIAPDARLFIDVGANTGVWSKLFLNSMKQPGKGILFEPSSLAVEFLTENLKHELKNGLVEIIPAAVCDNIGSMDFYTEEGAGETSSLIAKHSGETARKISVKTTTIDDVVEKRGLKFVDFLKIDAEGYDLQVLRGAGKSLSAKVIGVIQFEYNAPWVYSSSTLASALELLHGYGYELFLLKSGGLYRFDYGLFGDYFRYSNFVAVAPGYLNVTICDNLLK
jgi:FkbM family methyltransferase